MNKLAIGISAACALATSLVSADCESIFQTQLTLSPSKFDAASPASKNVPLRAREDVVLREPNRQFPSNPIISSSHLQVFSNRVGESGEHITLQITRFPNVLNPSKRDSDIDVSQGNRGKILRKYVREVELRGEKDPPKEVVDFLIASFQEDPHMLALATEHAAQELVRGANTQITLSNFDLNRYFRFQPSDRAKRVDARVLDIHQIDRFKGAQTLVEGYQILVEWFDQPVSQRSAGSTLRRRYVTPLSVEELKTVTDLERDTRLEIAARFSSTLSPIEHETRLLARAAGLQTYGYTDLRRQSGSSSGPVPSALLALSMPIDLAIGEFIRKRFGFELSREENIVDWMAQRHPDEVLTRFESRGDGFVYFFVVTEDGLLKVSPHGPAGNNLKPFLIRLAMGRRIFVGGKFHVDEEGALHLQYDSNFYQAAGYYSGDAFGSGKNPDFNEFVSTVFRLQASRRVASIGSRKAAPFSKGSYSEGFFGRFESDAASERAGRIHAEQAAAQATSKLSWDPEGPLALNKDAPLSWQHWQLESKLKTSSGANLKMIWAHYILRTTSKQSFDEIKSQYRKLALKFHPDKIPSAASRAQKQRGEEIFKLITEAYEVVSAFYESSGSE